MRTFVACSVMCLALVSCGGAANSRSATRPTTAAAGPAAASLATRKAAVRAHTFIPPPANAIVSMRRFSPVSLMWQTVFVRPDGSGLLTSLIGETAGAPHRSFRLSSHQLATLRRLIATARSVKPGPSRPGPFLYTLHLPGEATMSLEGPMPKRIGALLNFLDGLTLTYCC